MIPRHGARRGSFVLQPEDRLRVTVHEWVDQFDRIATRQPTAAKEIGERARDTVAR